MSDQPLGPGTVPELLARNSSSYGVKPAIVADDGVLTHAELDERGRAFARRLVGAGVGKSSRVGLLMPNGVAWAVTAVAVMRIGATLVPLSTLLRPPELAAALRAASVTDLVLTETYRGRHYLDDLDTAAPGVVATTDAGERHPALPYLRHVWTRHTLPGDPVAADLVTALEAVVRPSDDLAIVFTSGSRGAPKGVIHTHGNALRAVAAGLECRRIGPDDRVYIPMPFFWTGGFSSGLITTLVAGATLLTESTSDPEKTLELLERERATLFRGWPDQAAKLAAHPRFAAADLSSLRAGSLPAVLPAGQRPAPGARSNLFGMTESFGPYCGDPLDRDLPASKWGSCGRPFPGVEVRVVDPETGAGCAPGEPGEIRLRGPNLMRGICGRTRAETFDADGFYPTGDLGALDSDGYLWFRGRLDDMFKVAGATVYPAEVEAALRGIDGVRQAFVTKVSAGPAAAADVVGAVVVSTSAGTRELAAASAARLSSFKVPKRWLVLPALDDVPMLATGKVDTPALARLLAERGTAPAT
jgi:acyl-CoA synthetase (AMP-forming)/AMP-acid ligase II